MNQGRTPPSSVTPFLSVWVVQVGDLQPVHLEGFYPTVEEALLRASRFLYRTGAVMLDLRNVRWSSNEVHRATRSSLLVYDWVGTLPISVVIEGGQVTDKGLPLPDNEPIGPVPMMSGALSD